MDKGRIAGTAHQAKGAVKESAGNAQNATGGVKDTAREAMGKKSLFLLLG